MAYCIPSSVLYYRVLIKARTFHMVSGITPTDLTTGNLRKHVKGFVCTECTITVQDWARWLVVPQSNNSITDLLNQV